MEKISNIEVEEKKNIYMEEIQEIINNEENEEINYVIKKYENRKKFFDIFFCTSLLVITSPILSIACIGVYCQDFKNPIYIQKRVGLNGKEFKMFKVRSMIIDAEKNGAKWAEKNDTRITWIGKIIRKTRIDELPQLINVIKGEMSLIGPRPEREVFYQEFEKTIPKFRERLKVKPGITGYAQVNGGYEATPEEKLKKDLYYIKNRSFKLDYKILFKTIGTVISGDGAR